jgi:hypothetical protein
MKAAYLVIDSNTALVNARDVDHSCYSQIFQCPYCKEALHLRAGYERNSSWVDPTFVHPKGNAEDCEARAEQGSQVSGDVFTVIQRGQNSKKLERAFSNCFQNYFRGWPGSRICCDKKYNIKIPRYDYIYRFRLVSDQYYLSKKYVEKFIEHNSKPGEVHESPELFIQVLSKIIRDKRGSRFIEHLISDFQPSLLSMQESSEYVIKLTALDSVGVKEFMGGHYHQLSAILKYFRFGTSEKLRRDVLNLLVWANYKELPISPTKIETASDQKKRRMCMKHHVKQEHHLNHGKDFSSFYSTTNRSKSYYLLSPEEIVEQVLEKALEENFEKARRSQIEKIQQFTPEFLTKMDQSTEVIAAAFLDFYKQEVSLGSIFIDFALRKLVSSAQAINWKRLPDLYQSGLSPYCGLDMVSHEATMDIECPISELFSRG